MVFKDMWGDVVHTLGLSTRAANDETAYAKRFINEGVVDLLSRTRPSNQYMNLGLKAGVIAHQDIVFPGYGYLDRMSREEAVRAQQYGGYGFAYLEPLLWVAPIVDVDTYVEAHGTFRPTPLSGDTDDPSQIAFGWIAPEFHPAIVNSALWKSADLIQHSA